MLFSKAPQLALFATFLGSYAANILTPFPISATNGALKFQPVLDFDKDACYQSTAVGTDGQVNSGIDSRGLDSLPRAVRRRAIPGEGGVEPPSHPKMVYHQGSVKNHSFRKAAPEDDAIENETGQWFKAPLVSLEQMPCDINHKLLNNDWGIGNADLKKDRFPGALNSAMPDDARNNNEGFNPWQ